MSEQPLTLVAFNTAEESRVRSIMAAVLDISEYVDEIVGGRPYPDLSALVTASAEAAGRITWPQVAGALARHPRIGERKTPDEQSSGEQSPDEQSSGEQSSGEQASGEPASAPEPGTAGPAASADTTAVEASWSAGEQSGVKDTEIDAFANGNAEYERRFGFIFLICASGLSGEQMLTSLRERLRHTEKEEQPIVISELRKIAALRLMKAVQA
ncbi:2-oxo-4-hydroxy-4-carboxy-5-ureidoimidazoline decarboxylase [Nakamurella silvestris]|nr:2-oxo-4-hydroxy-4-carboxy-5-ureidoimidazoline decarboxylase [Nakamurella silvestris]